MQSRRARGYRSGSGDPGQRLAIDARGGIVYASRRAERLLLARGGVPDALVGAARRLCAGARLGVSELTPPG